MESFIIRNNERTTVEAKEGEGSIFSIPLPINN